MLQLSTPVNLIKGVGPRNAEALKKRGVETAEDLLYHLPFRYEDRLHPKPLAELKAGEMASVIGEVRGTTILRAVGSMSPASPAARRKLAKERRPRCSRWR